jgi:predicted dehydrogenase
MGAHPGTEKIRSMKLAAICDMNEALAKKVAKSYHIDSYYADLSEMLKGEDELARSLDANCLSALLNQQYQSQVLV